MKTVSAVTPDLKCCNIGGFGVFFALSVLTVFSRQLFLPFRNEFHSVLLISIFLFFFAAGSTFLPGRKSTFRFHEFLLFILSANLICLILLRHHAEIKFIIPVFFLAAGRISGYLRRQVLSGSAFTASCLGGAAAGMLACALTIPHWNPELPVRYFPAPLLMILLVQLIVILKQKTAASLKILLAAAWLLLPVQFCLLNEPEGNGRGAAGTSSESELKPALIVQSVLQPNRKHLKVMFIGDSVQVLRQLSDFAAIRKLTVFPLKDGTGLFHKLNSESEDFDLILIQMPLPDSLYGERFYSVKFCQILKDRLEPDGVLAVWLPDDMLLYRKNHLLGLYGTAGSMLCQVFPTVKPAGDEPLFLLCGSKNISVDPEELNRRAGELLADAETVPREVFLMHTREEQLEQERNFRAEMLRSGGQDGRSGGLLWRCIRSLPWLDRTILGRLADECRGILLYFLTGVTVLFLVIRYFYSGGLEIKQIFLSWENGLHTGLMLLMFLLPFQQHSGRLYRDWMLLGAIFLLSALAGMCLSWLNRGPLPRILLGLSLLLPLCGLGFQQGYGPDTPLFYAAAAFIGITGGLVCGLIRAELAPSMTGLSAGLLLGSVLFWLPYGIVPCILLAILTRIPPASSGNLQKLFDKSARKG